MTDKNSWWDKFSDANSIEKIEHSRRKSIFYLVSFGGALVIALFSLKSYQTYNAWLSFVLAFSATVIICNAICALKFRHDDLFYYLGAFFVFIMLMGIAYSGGYQNTGLYWLYPFPIIFFVLLGIKLGLLTNLLLFFSYFFMLIAPIDIPADYREVEIHRFLSSYAVSVLVCLVAEYFRHQSYTELATLSDHKQRQANTDSLTKLPNRRFLSSVLFERFAANDHYFPLTIAYIDLDYFKAINDNYGHDAGDVVLRSFAELCCANIRKSDIIARTGGEEFILIFTNTDIETGLKLCDKFRLLLADTQFDIGGKEIQCTASFGIAQCNRYAELDNALKLADKRMYIAKQNGRNQVVNKD